MTRLFLPESARSALLTTGHATWRKRVEPQPCKGVNGKPWCDDGSDLLALCPAPPGREYWCAEKHWISDCGRYLAIRSSDSNSWSQCDVATVDGKIVWIGGDPARGHNNRALPRQTTGWSVLPHASFSEYRRGCFSVSFADCDPDIELIPFTGNTIKQGYEAVFKRQRAPMSMPRWAARLHVRVTSVRVVRDGEWFWQIEMERIPQ